MKRTRSFIERLCLFRIPRFLGVLRFVPRCQVCLSAFPSAVLSVLPLIFFFEINYYLGWFVLINMAYAPWRKGVAFCKIGIIKRKNLQFVWYSIFHICTHSLTQKPNRLSSSHVRILLVNGWQVATTVALRLRSRKGISGIFQTPTRDYHRKSLS